MVGTRPLVVVVGMGPAGVDLVPPAAEKALKGAARTFVRTRWHPAAEVVPDAASFDSIYESAADFESAYKEMVEEIVAAAVELKGRGYVCYAVPGSPFVAERSVELLLADGRADVEVVPAMSFVELAWARLGIDPFAEGVRLVDAESFALEAAGQPGPFLVAQCWSKEVLSQIKLSADPDHPAARAEAVTVLARLGLDDEKVFEVPWDELDRMVQPDHMTSLYVPAMAAPVAAELVALEELVRVLRERCPWDRAQTHRSLTRHLVEETYEVLDAIAFLERARDQDTGEEARAWDDLEEELGDLLFQVMFHARLAAEEGAFDLAQVAARTRSKLIARHPHVFSDVVADTPEQVMTNWEQIKKQEKGYSSIMDNIPGSLPSLQLALKVQRKAASVGFDWQDPTGPFAKVSEELIELKKVVGAEQHQSSRACSELGDVLFSVVNLARHLGVDPEVALRESSQRFIRRFSAMERAAAGEGRELVGMDLAELDVLWERAKAAERAGRGGESPFRERA
jgi:tetrapyrrole methylase family protein/MazG family protein